MRLPCIRALTITFATACAFAQLSPASAGNEERGREIALRWCTACHVVASDVAGGTLGPAFSAIVPLRGRSDAELATWLAAPHEPMPDFGLSVYDIDDLIDYIHSLGDEG